MFRKIALAATMLCAVSAALADDWPAYRHDNGRTGTTSESIDTKNLQPAWILRPSQPPRKAHTGPAKWDAFRGMQPMGDATRFDSVFHPVIVGDRLYYGSSADDAVHCIDTKTGRQRWAFTVGGPVRLPPSFLDGKLYFASDDGYAYCITAKDGRLVWQFSPTAGRRKVFHDGRLISRWPIRTGVSVESGTAYFAASMIPGNESFLCAVDAKTGKPEGEGRMVRETKRGQTYMGMMALGGGYLAVPQGRNGGHGFRIPGLKPARGTGVGCFLMIADGHVAAGAGTGGVVLNDWSLTGPSQHRTHVGRFAGCYVGDTAYLIAHEAITAFERKGWKPIWQVRAKCRAVIAAGRNLIIGADGEVRVHAMADGKTIWKAKVWGKVDGLAVANGAIYAATTDGLIYCFRPNAKAAADPYVKVTPSKREGLKGGKATPSQVGVTAGPYVEFTGPATAVVRWRTEEPSPTVLEGAKGVVLHRDEKKKLVHEVRLNGLRPMTNYGLRVLALVDGEAPLHTIETFYNYASPAFDGVASPYADDAVGKACETAAEKIVRLSSADRGICIVVGSGDGRLAFEIARRTKLFVIGLEKSDAKLASARAALQKTGRYGVRVSFQKVTSYGELATVPSACANLVVSQAVLTDGKPVGRAAEFCRILRPLGGMAVIGQPGKDPALDRVQLDTWLKPASLDKKINANDGLWAVIRRPDPLPGSGAWSHQYGDGTNAAYGAETLQGARKVSDMSIQWLGRPGPRHHADRQVRKPAPLVRNGRLFVQGMERLTALDIFNGVVLWSLEIPGLNRYNMPREGGNYCADDDYVYVVHDGRCWKIDAATGKVVHVFDTVNLTGRVLDPAWSHVALAGNLLIGSTARKSSHFPEYWGDDCWYDKRIGVSTGKICSMSLFGLDKSSGKVKWSYTKALMLNSSITIGDGRIYFVAITDEKTMGETLANQWSRMYGSFSNTRHIAIDQKTGKVVWDVPFTGDTGMTAFYQAYSGETLVTVGCSRPYNVNGYDAKTGKELWAVKVKLDGEGHGGATQRPVIVDGKVFLCTTVLDLKTGKKLYDCPRGNCGTAGASKYALIYRSGSIAMWPLTGKEEPTRIDQVRPDCWLSMVPGSGMFLAPEGAGGCRCGGGVRFSVGLIPRTDLPRFRLGPQRFLDTLDVTVDAPLNGEAVYTTDGSDPTLQSAKVAGPITLTKTSEIRVRARGVAPGPALSSCVVRRYEKVQPKERASAAKVNFQPADNGPVPEGYWIDTGDVAKIHTNGFAYGWTDENRTGGRFKKNKSPAVDTVVRVRGPVQWQAAVEDGKYEVIIGVRCQKDYREGFVVNGVTFAVDPAPAEKEWTNRAMKRQVEVKGGILSLRAASPDLKAKNMHLAYIEFRKL